MNELEQTAQQRLEAKALANSRALLDKLQRIEWHANHTNIKGKKKWNGLEGLHGTAVVSIRMVPNRSAEAVIEQSSRDPVLDDRMLALVQLAQPFGSPPAGLGGTALTIRARMTGRDVDGKNVLAVENP